MKTFKDLYLEAKVAPTPAQEFISRVAEISCREESTVRQWLSGTQTPPRRVKQQIAKAFNSSVEELFPEDIETEGENES